MQFEGEAGVGFQLNSVPGALHLMSMKENSWQLGCECKFQRFKSAAGPYCWMGFRKLACGTGLSGRRMLTAYSCTRTQRIYQS